MFIAKEEMMWAMFGAYTGLRVAEPPAALRSSHVSLLIWALLVRVPLLPPSFPDPPQFQNKAVNLSDSGLKSLRKLGVDLNDTLSNGRHSEKGLRVEDVRLKDLSAPPLDICPQAMLQQVCSGAGPAPCLG